VITLNIKGSADVAHTALNERGFNSLDWLSSLQESPGILTTSVTTRVDVRDECEPGVIRWYAEQPSADSYPLGTLLCYSYHKE